MYIMLKLINKLSQKIRESNDRAINEVNHKAMIKILKEVLRNDSTCN
jgi:hypothetical protein